MLDYLRQLSAPTNAQMVADHFRGALSKAEAERRCTELVAQGHVESREAGKVKLFWASQKDVVALSKTEETTLTRDLADANAQCAAQAADVAKLHGAMKALKAQRSIEAVREEVTEARSKAQMAVDRVEEMRKEHGGGQPMTASEEARLRKEYGRMRKLYLERRGRCLEVLANMSEHLGKSTKKLFADLGLEADEDYGVDREAFPLLH